MLLSYSVINGAQVAKPRTFLDNALPDNGLSLPVNEVHLWVVDDSAPQVVQSMRDFKALLSDDELTRLASIKSVKRQRQFLIARAALRSILSLYLAPLSPQHIRFASNSSGKPALEDMNAQVHFNLSHSHGKVLIGVAKNRALGVDIERIDPARDVGKIAEHYFHPSEWQPLSRQQGASMTAEDVRCFYTLWTLKEAFIKALGKGLFIPTTAFFFENWQAKRPHLRLSDPLVATPSAWCFETLNAAAGYCAAVAFEDKGDADNVRVITYFAD